MTDVFDDMMNGACDVLKKYDYGTGHDDAFGQPDQTFITIISSWPCRVSTMKGGQDYKAIKEYAKNSFRVFMRPITITDSGVPVELSTHNWLKVTKVNGVTLALPKFFNIIGVNDPSLLGHHLEVLVEEVIP